MELLDPRMLMLCLILAMFTIGSCATPEEDAAERLRQKSFKIVSVLTPPFLMKTDAGTYEGYVVDLAQLLSERAAFNYSIYEAPDGMIGSKTENGQWNGMMLELIDRKADFGIGPMTITVQRETVVDFTKPFMSTGITMVSKKSGIVPRDERSGHTHCLVLMPFTVHVWIMLIVAYIVTGLLLGVMDKMSNGASEPVHMCIGRGYWYAAQGITLQGLRESPKAISLRILYTFWCAFSIATIILYAANLVNMLRVETSGHDVRPQHMTVKDQAISVDSLLKQEGIEYGTMKGSTAYDFFRISKISMYERLYSNMKNSDNLVDTIDDGIAKVRNSGGEYVFFTETGFAEYYATRAPCDIQVGALLNSVGYGVAMPIGSSYTDILSMSILELAEIGELGQLYSKWYGNTCPVAEPTPETPNETPNNDRVLLLLPRGVQAKQFMILPLYLLLGIVLSGVAAIVEYVRKPKSQKPNESKEDCAGAEEKA